MKRFQNIFKKKLSYEKKADFFEFINQMVSSSVPIYDMFDISEANVFDKNIIKTIRSSLKDGKPLSKAIESTDVFDDMAISIINMGEESGCLDESFKKLSSYYKDMSENKKNFEKALFYPLILITAIIFLITFLNYYFIPSMRQIYSIDPSELGKIPSFIFKVSDILNTYRLTGFIILSSALFLIIQFAGNVIKYSDVGIPFITDIINKRRISNIIWSYSVLLSSGIDFINSSMIISKRSKNQKTKTLIKKMLSMIKQGHSVTESVKSLDLKDDRLIYFISMAENTGNIEKCLLDLYKLYNADIKKKTDILKLSVEPVLIIFVTIVTGAIILGVIMPIINIADLSL